MTLFVQDTNLTLCLWILGSIVLAVALLLLSVKNHSHGKILAIALKVSKDKFDGKRDELREAIIYPEGSFTAALAEALTKPHDRLKQLEGKITSKNFKLEISQEKLEETKRTISELEVTSEEVQNKYQELLKQLKSELSRTEKECQHLHNQIEKITTKRDKLKQELGEVCSSLKIARTTSSSAITEDYFSSDFIKAPNFHVQDRRSPDWPKPDMNVNTHSFVLDGDRTRKY